ncbi:F0F1 ATP synthase subunit epsilon [Psychroflexus salinarum]|uniref:F0F1 ATP synthase subunit epsilon n=1 Tax=Psychroflexus salinarum TaxID=546024 RepID=A0ABW3GRW2_9FLAO
MHLEIVSPEQIILSEEVKSVNVPGINGEFQILDNHAPVVSVLQKGTIKLDSSVTLPKKSKDKFYEKDSKLNFDISGGVIELQDNKVVILID